MAKSAVGHEQTYRHVRVMSVIPLKADIRQRKWHVRYVPCMDGRPHLEPKRIGWQWNDGASARGDDVRAIRPTCIINLSRCEQSVRGGKANGKALLSAD